MFASLKMDMHFTGNEIGNMTSARASFWIGAASRLAELRKAEAEANR